VTGYQCDRRVPFNERRLPGAAVAADGYRTSPDPGQDDSPRPPACTVSEADVEAGRGLLLLVEAVSRAAKDASLHHDEVK
jgi:hypothetical protein